MLERIAAVLSRSRTPGVSSAPSRTTEEAIGLSEREREIALTVMRSSMPAGERLAAPTSRTVDRWITQAQQLSRKSLGAFRALLWTLEYSTVARHRHVFSRLASEAQLETLERWARGPFPQRLALRVLLAPMRVAHFSDPVVSQAVGARYEIEIPKTLERHRWQQNILTPEDLDPVEKIEADVVVIGTGAGGAVVAKELAERGFAVAMVEAGRFFGRQDFNGRAFDAMSRMYWNAGTEFALGNCPILIPSGRTVGGTTTVNSGTCLRAPERILNKWVRDYGLVDFTPEAMNPYFERVERILGVEPARAAYLGGCARVIRRGCEALGYTNHGPLPRNAPECDGQGLCCFGCPTDAKRSTNVSYVPLALQSHASLFTQYSVSKILREGDRIVGVRAESTDRKVLEIRAQATVVSCGTYRTPTLLMKNGLAGSSGVLGKNLTLHPAVAAMAEFDEEIVGWKAIPQGYFIKDLEDQGIVYEGGFTPVDLGAAAYPFVGPEFTRLMEHYNHIAAFGFMVEDSSRGEVRTGPGGRPLVRYSLNSTDLAKVHLGVVKLAEIYFAAGAKRVFPPIDGFERLETLQDLEDLRRAKIRASDLTLTAFHPLGTARLGLDSGTSVVDQRHRVHGLEGLYIIDGSSVPSSLGANPQITIMALATRASELLAETLS